MAHFQLVHGGQGFTVEQHASVEGFGHLRGPRLDVGVMRRNHAKTPAFVQLFKKDFRQCAPQLGVRPGAKLVEQHQAGRVGDVQEVSHSSQSVAVGGKLVLDALVVANVRQDRSEDAHFRRAVTRNEQPTLDHHLKEPHRFHGDAFSTGVGPADDQHALLSVKLHVLRKGLLACDFVGLLQERVVRGKQMEARLFPNLGQAAVKLRGQTCPRRDPIQFRQAPLVPLDGREVATDVAGQFA